MKRALNRRDFVAQSVATASLASRSASGQTSVSDDASSTSTRPVFGLIGAGWQSETGREGRGIAIGRQAARIGDVAMICEVDSVAGHYAKRRVTNDQAALVGDYRRVLDNPKINAVLIATPDHWHAKMAVDAMRAGKDVYCEKPVALTIDEGKALRRVVAETGRVFQVGTQQRSEYDGRFLKAIAMVRDGRIGQVQRVRVGLGPGWQGGPFATKPVPSTLQWERWLGPAPMTAYIPERTHRTFRWWFEYGGGQICDWGAHHVDIAQWAIGKHESGPIRVAGTGTLNQPLVDGMPSRVDQYNTPIEFNVHCEFAGGVAIQIDSTRNGITFEGDRGRFFVNRGTLEGKPVDELDKRPLPADWLRRMDGRSGLVSHMQNFADCIASRATPASDIRSHHRTLTTCHLANLSIRLGREIRWDPEHEIILDDETATKLMSRNYRAGYELELA